MNQAYTFDNERTALCAANMQQRAVNKSINDVLSLLYILNDKLRANENTCIYASALGCVETMLETLYEDTVHEFVVSNQAIQADLSHDNQAVNVIVLSTE